MSRFEQFIKKSIKQDLFNLTYHDEVFSSMLRDFVPQSDFFIKPERACSPVAIGDDGSVYAQWKRPENRKMRKSKKLEFLTSVLDAMMASIYAFSKKLRDMHESELLQVRGQITIEQGRMQKKLEKLKFAVSEVSHKSTNQDCNEWENLEWANKNL